MALLQVLPFCIVQHLIDYQQGDTYGRVFIVGLLNTLLVSALCIVFASVLGFFIGLARLSDNWLLRKLSTIYIEIFRNIPPLLQIFFWYFAVLRNLPGPRQAVSAFDLAFLSNRGLYIPSPQLGDGFIAFILAVVMAIVLSVGLFRFNKTYQIKTGQLRRTWPIAAVKNGAHRRHFFMLPPAAAKSIHRSHAAGCSASLPVRATPLGALHRLTPSLSASH